jgi:branched-chain amino acid transport system substrate-binding protein
MKKRHVVFTLALLLVLATLGCGTAATEVQIGAILSMEGRAAPYGRSIWQGMQVAMDEINAAGGIDVGGSGTMLPLSIAMRDDQSDPEMAMRHAQELIELQVPVVIAADSSEIALAIAPLFQEAEIIFMSPSASTPKLSEEGDYIYRNFPSDALEAVNMATYIYNSAGIHEVAILGSQTEYGLGVKNAFISRFRMLGGTVTAQASFEAEAQDVSAQIAELADADFGGIYIAGYSSEVAIVARAVRDAGIDVPLFGTGAILAEELVELGGEAVEGLVFPSPLFDAESDIEESRRFVAAYQERFGESYDVYAAHGWDAVKIVAQAIQENGLRPEEIRFYLNAMNPFEGAAGTTSFDDKGDVRKFHRMFVIEGGIAVPVTAGSGA